MYELVTVLALGSTYLAIHFQPNERNNISPAPPLPRSRAYFAITLLALYTHYSAFYVWIAENIFVLWRHLSLRAARSAAKQSPVSNLRSPISNLGIASQRSLAMTDPARRWFFLQFALVAAYVPWIIAQSNFLSAKSSARFDEWSWRGVEIVFGKTLASFSAGLTLDPPLSILLIFGFGILVLVGLIIALRDHSAARLAP
ncbi:MAG: hypothetical protein HY070_00885, partial [Chloroflexi bacterium]|nr:hypothetical protein [Chloroflexota bacterium]